MRLQFLLSLPRQSKLLMDSTWCRYSSGREEEQRKEQISRRDICLKLICVPLSWQQTDWQEIKLSWRNGRPSLYRSSVLPTPPFAAHHLTGFVRSHLKFSVNITIEFTAAQKHNDDSRKRCWQRQREYNTTVRNQKHHVGYKRCTFLGLLHQSLWNISRNSAALCQD